VSGGVGSRVHARCARKRRSFRVTGLTIAQEIKGLGWAGASGLLAVLFPAWFGTADQFVVRALLRVPEISEASLIAKMNPDGLTKRGAATLITIMRQKASDNTRVFQTSSSVLRA
jgi:hypothetical protein